MKCEELLQYLSDYIDQELDEELTAEAQEHLATCHNCRVVLDSTQQTIFLFREQGKRTIPAQSRSRLFAQLQDAFLKSQTHQ
ncbi:MAG: zf-HC2 domain-containing protein [Ardenticatenaceae bacterium]|nr:zf-HC2 domain-containing protein [Anaerolineales bacterium]MCB9009588.1 zf-HC2 domain-containing protein [Ardenticatenaceae bacterium]